MYLPRYNRFVGAATELAKLGHSFKEVAGNNSAIMITVLTDDSAFVAPAISKTVFTQTISSDPKWKRVALVVPVSDLHKFLKEPLKVEHVFDY